MVQTYNEYLRLLEDVVVKNGRRALSDLQIDQFIRHNKLDSDWQIIASEVEEDMMILKSICNSLRQGGTFILECTSRESAIKYFTKGED